MHDRIENAGYLRTSPHVPVPHQHRLPVRRRGFRAGGAVLAGAAAGRAVWPCHRSWEAESRTFIAPAQNWVQQTFQHTMQAEPDGSVPVAIVNPSLDGGQGCGLYVVYNQKQMPNYIEWRMMGEGQYTVGIEPCTSGFDREQVEAAGQMIWLEPGDVREYDLEVGILDGGRDRGLSRAGRPDRAGMTGRRGMPEDTYGHTPIRKAFEQADVYGVAHDEQRASRAPVRLAIAGAGGVAQSKYLPAVARLRTIWEPVEIAAVAARTEAKGRNMAAIWDCRWYADWREMIANEPLDGVIVAGPDELHAEMGIACLKAGLPVLVEKPITRSLVESEQLCRMGDETGLILMTVSNKRYSPPYRRAKRFIDEGPVEDPALFAGKFNLGYDYVDMFESGTIHLFDIMRYLMGDVRTVRAVGVDKYGHNWRGYPFDNAICQFEFASGAVGTLVTSASALSSQAVGTGGGLRGPRLAGRRGPV